MARMEEGKGPQRWAGINIDDDDDTDDDNDDNDNKEDDGKQGSVPISCRGGGWKEGGQGGRGF